MDKIINQKYFVKKPGVLIYGYDNKASVNMGNGHRWYLCGFDENFVILERDVVKIQISVSMFEDIFEIR